MEIIRPIPDPFSAGKPQRRRHFLRFRINLPYITEPVPEPIGTHAARRGRAAQRIHRLQQHGAQASSGRIQSRHSTRRPAACHHQVVMLLPECRRIHHRKLPVNSRLLATKRGISRTYGTRSAALRLIRRKPLPIRPVKAVLLSFCHPGLMFPAFSFRSIHRHRRPRRKTPQLQPRQLPLQPAEHFSRCFLRLCQQPCRPIRLSGPSLTQSAVRQGNGEQPFSLLPFQAEEYLFLPAPYASLLFKGIHSRETACQDRILIPLLRSGSFLLLPRFIAENPEQAALCSNADQPLPAAGLLPGTISPSVPALLRAIHGPDPIKQRYPRLQAAILQKSLSLIRPQQPQLLRTRLLREKRTLLLRKPVTEGLADILTQTAFLHRQQHLLSLFGQRKRPVHCMQFSSQHAQIHITDYGQTSYFFTHPSKNPLPGSKSFPYRSYPDR